ncbi:hypothetical protein [Bacteroides sp.]|uniref:hypothetical protein n=1 Tax=Bacteroides sp. TaxID=29523 RepID=UPI003AB118FC
MKTSSIILLLLFAVLATSCGVYTGSYGFNSKQLGSIERGMDFEEVCTILGEPVLRDLDSEGEAWTFRSNGNTGCSVVKIWFEDGKVVEMKSRLEGNYPSSAVREVNSSDEKGSTGKSSGTKVAVGPDGKHYIDTGSSVVVSSDGKHYIKTGSVVVTPEGKHIVIP